jgi:hypothetical protein
MEQNVSHNYPQIYTKTYNKTWSFLQTNEGIDEKNTFYAEIVADITAQN